MGARFVEMRGVKIAYHVWGEGQPLVLVMGYRLSSMAWPPALIEQLARRFMVIALDNRGTGLSDKPVKGYAIANIARDVCGVLDELKLTQVHMLGYSMGGAIAQEFVRQFPERVSRLILCATMAGGPRAKYATASVVAVMRDLDGLSAEQAARRIWKVTYSSSYLERHRDLAEEQMRREVVLPTPLHAADLQFQAFAEFDGSKALTDVRCPSLLLTGDLDELIPPENAVMMAKIIPAARLVVLHGCGHRVLWEDTRRCVELITEFLDSARGAKTPDDPKGNQRHMPTASDTLTSAMELLATWPLTLIKAGFESIAVARQSLLVGSASRFGDGKPIILVQQLFGANLVLLPIAVWLKTLGYRPVIVGPSPDQEGSPSDGALSQVIHEVTRRVGRKGILITHSFDMSRVLVTAATHKELVSDVVVIGVPDNSGIDGVRIHFISAWSALQLIMELPQLLRSIGLELIEMADSSSREGGFAASWPQRKGAERLGQSEDADD